MVRNHHDVSHLQHLSVHLRRHAISGRTAVAREHDDLRWKRCLCCHPVRNAARSAALQTRDLDRDAAPVKEIPDTGQGACEEIGTEVKDSVVRAGLDPIGANISLKPALNHGVMPALSGHPSLRVCGRRWMDSRLKRE